MPGIFGFIKKTKAPRQESRSWRQRAKRLGIWMPIMRKKCLVLSWVRGETFARWPYFSGL